MLPVLMNVPQGHLGVSAWVEGLSGRILFPWTAETPRWICLEQAVSVGVRDSGLV